MTFVSPFHELIDGVGKPLPSEKIYFGKKLFGNWGAVN
jgi:hypothetical protein